MKLRGGGGGQWVYTDKKENQIFLIYKEIQSGAVAKLYIRKGFLIYEELFKYRPLVIYDFATAPFWISSSMRKILFSFYQCIVLLGSLSSYIINIGGSETHCPWNSLPSLFCVRGQIRKLVFSEAVLLLQIRLIEGNAKCRHLKTLTSKGTLRHVFICLRLRTP